MNFRNFALEAILLAIYLLQLVESIPWRSPGETKPRRIEIPIGGSANITCRMNMQIFADKNSSNMFFFEANKGIQLPLKDIFIVNETTIVYMIKNAAEETSQYVCKVDDQGIDTTQVYVGTPPVDVNDFTCRGYDFVYMVCKFTLPQNMVFTNYKLYYSAQSAYHSSYWLNGSKVYTTKYSQNYIHECKLKLVDGPPMIVCNLTLDEITYRPLYEFFNFSLTATNSLGTKTQSFWINQHDSIIPPKPNVNFSDITTNSVVLSWHMIKYSLYRPKGLDFEIKLRPDGNSWFDVKNYELRYSKTEFKVKIENLEFAYRKYDISVRVKVRTAKNDGTMWSEPFLGLFRTKGRIPDNPPRTDVGSFSTNTADTNLRLYWQQLPEYRENGPNFSYIISDVKVDGKSVNILPIDIDRTSASYLWRSQSMYEFSIQSRNDFGQSLESSYIRISKMRKDRFDYTPQWIRKVYHNRMYTLSWSPPEKFMELIDYTVFWCISKMESPNQCKSSINFIHMDKYTRNFTTEPQNHTLNLAISANYMEYNAGMHWAMCTAEVTSDLMKLDPEMTAISSSVIKVQWSSECIYTSILEGYNLKYCRVENNVSIDAAVCLDGNATTVIIETTAKEFEITGLKPFSTYKIEIFMFSKVKKGPTSDSVLFTTTEDAPTPPRHLKYSNITSNSAVISWLPPKQTNGNLRFYTVWQNNEQHVVNITNSTVNGEIFFKLENLSSFSEYKVYVTAQTVETSLPSNDIHFKTLIGIPSNPRHINVIKKNTHVNLYWERPLVPSGRIDFYEVSVSVSRNNIVERKRITPVNGNFCQLNIPECTDPQYSHSLEVRAVNLAASDEIDHHTFSKRDTQEHRLIYEKIPDIRMSAIREQTTSSTKNNENTNILDSDYEGNDDLKCIGEHSKEETMLLRMKHNKFSKKFQSEWERGPIYACGQIKFSELTKIALFGVTLSLITMGALYILRNKYNKMKNIDCVIPPGLEAYSNEIVNNNIVEKDDMHRSEESLYHKENHHLLASICNDSSYLNGGGQCSIGKSSGYVGSDRSTESSEQSLQNSDPVELHNILGTAANTFNSADDKDEKHIISSSTLLPEDSSARMFISPNVGYIKPAIMMYPNIGNSNGYVQPQCLPKQQTVQPTFDGYTTLEAMGKFIVSPNNLNPTIPSSTTVSVTTPGANAKSLISGYVTHKQLSEFGQQRLK